jgi:hypothetical protein
MSKGLAVALITMMALMSSKQPSSAAEIAMIPPDSVSDELGAIIGVSGDIVAGDSLRFQNVAKQAGNRATVLFNSNGGSLEAGIEIGREIHRLAYQTAVVDTCASACALAWLAGTNRFSADTAKIGFHVAFVDGVEKRESGMGNAIVGLYVGELGYGQNVVEYVTSAAPDNMQWLNVHDAALLGIKVETFVAKSLATVPVASAAGSEALKLKAIDFVYANVAVHANDGAAALQNVLNTYSSRVLYYGKDLSVSEVYNDKKSYFERWNSRSSLIRSDSVTASCEGTVCIVTGIYQWQVSSTKRSKSASGLASFSYGLAMYPQISVISEDGKVLTK